MVTEDLFLFVNITRHERANNSFMVMFFSDVMRFPDEASSVIHSVLLHCIKTFIAWPMAILFHDAP